MATTVAQLMATLGLDSSNFNKGLGDAENKSKGFGSVLNGLSKAGGAILAVGFAAAAASAVALGHEIFVDVKRASDLNETITKTQVVFGESSAGILAWSKTSATALGASQADALAAAATYGNLFRAMNMTEEMSSDMSMNLVNLSGDLASFNNMDPTEVMDKLRAGLSGETEPLKSLGININETIIKQKAMELGIYDGVDAITAAQKAQAAYALILEQTSLAQGDFARTSGGLANQQRILKAQIENLRTTFGTKFLPIFIEFTTKINEFISRPETIAFIEDLSNKLSTFLSAMVTKLPGFLNALMASFGWLMENKGVIVAAVGVIAIAVLTFLASMAVAAWTAMAPLLPVVAVIALIGAAIYALYVIWDKNFLGIKDVTIWYFGLVKKAWKAVWDFMLPIVEYFIAQFNTLVQAFRALFSGDWETFGKKIREIWDRAWKAMITILQGADAIILTAMRAMVQKIFNVVASTDWKKLGENILKGIVAGMNSLESWMTAKIRDLANRILNSFLGFFNIHSRSQLMYDLVGKNIGLGLVEGAVDYGNLQPAFEGLEIGGGANTGSPTAGQSSGAFDYYLLAKILSTELAKNFS